MNSTNDDEGRRLRDALHGQVDSMTEAPLSLDDVSARAHRIRRNRMVTAGVGIAAAVAIIVPAGLMAGGAFQRSEDPAVRQRRRPPRPPRPRRRPRRPPTSTCPTCPPGPHRPSPGPTA